MIELTFLKQLMITRQANQKSAIFVDMAKVQTYICNECPDLLMMSMNFSNIAILNIKRADYHCIINGSSRNKAINLMQNINLIGNSKTL